MSNPRLKEILQAIVLRINEGEAFSDCLRRHPKVFDDFFISLVEVGERGGMLEQTLNRLALYLEQMAKLQRKIITALTYPSVIILVAAGSMAFLLIAVVPTFADMFKDFGSELPGPTQFLLDVGTFLKSNFIWLVTAMAAMLVIFLRLKKIRAVSYFLDKLLLKLPLFGTLLRKSFLAKFCQTLGTLLQGSVSLLDSLDVAKRISRNQIFQSAIEEMQQRVIRGNNLVSGQDSGTTFTPLTRQMIRVGEETGELDKMLLKVAHFYEDELDATIDALTSIIEPVIIVVLGVVLGGTLVAMYLQLFNVVDVIQ